ncbi:hypothetical protein PQQ96_27665 [Paraburkholderia sediminicola]|uniref:hypothetical protein n=1 Tax=Paraburkholderia sediminicola TaxID=458836 RepID=UPI0038BD1510
MENCTFCKKRHFGPVKFCPFCGMATSAAPAPELARELASSEPVASYPDVPETQSGATPASAVAVPVASADAKEQPAPTAPRAAADLRKDAGVATPVKAARKARVTTTEPGVEQPTPPSKPRKPRKILRNLALGAIAIVALLAFLGRGPNKQDILCTQQVEEGTRLVQKGDLAGATAQSDLAATSCTGDQSAKATQLQTLVATAKATRSECMRAYETVTARLNDGGLSAAVNGLNQLSLTCADSDDAARLKTQVEQASAAADAAEQQVRTAITGGDSVSAAAAVADLARIDRFRPTLASLRAQIADIPAAKPVEPTPAPPAPVPVVAGQPANAQSTMPPVVQQSAPAFNGQAAAAQQFLNDAQAALAQNHFDAAMTYIDSARRMDPTNARINALARVVQDRERQVLQDDTTIK